MAQDNRSYDDMSREELLAIIGGAVDPDTSQSELIDMAREADSQR